MLISYGVQTCALPISFIDGNRSNRNIERRIAAGIDPSHGAGICAAGVRLDFVDDLHRPQLRRACDRAAGKNRAEHVHWSQPGTNTRSEEHTSELQSLMRISYAVFCLKKKTTQIDYITQK